MHLFALLLLVLPGELLAQDWSWAWGAYSGDSELAKDVAVNDSLGEVFILGEFDGALTSLPGIPMPAASNTINGLLIKLDTNGALLDYIVIPSVGDLEMNALTLDDSGNVYVVGAFSKDVVFTGNGTDSIGLSQSIILVDGFIAKFTSNLEGVWATRLQGFFNQIGKDVAVNGSDVVLVGDFQNSVSSDTLPPLSSSGSYDVFVMSFDKGTGKPRWSNKLGGAGEDRVEGVVCHRGAIFLTGHFEGDSLYYPGNQAGALVNTNSGNMDFFVSRIDTNTRTGTWLVSGGGMGVDLAHGIGFVSGRVFVGGETNGNASFGAAGAVTSAGGRDGYVTSLDAATGLFQWVRPEGGGGNESVWDVTRDRLGNVVAVGEYSNTVVFSGGIPSTPVSGTDGFLVGYEPNGTPVSWLRRVGSTDQVVPRDVATAGSGIYASGEYLFSNTTFFAASSIILPGDGLENLFVGRLGCDQIPSPNLNATVDRDSVCQGDSVVVTIPLSLNTLSYQLINLDGDTLGPITSGVNGLLSLSSDLLDSTLSIGILVYGNGISCDVLAEDTFDVFVQPPFAPDLGPDDSSCGDSLVLVPFGSWSSYQWSTGATTDSILVGTSGNYNLEVTDSLGCLGRDTISVLISSNPLVDLGADTTICQGDSLNLNPGPGSMSYNWSTGEATDSIWVNSGGSFSVTVTDSLGCFSADTLQLNLDSLGLVLPTDTSFCQGDSVILDAGIAASSYSWSNGAGTQMVVVSIGGPVSVTVSNGTCLDSAQTNVAVFALPQPDLGPDTTLCNTGSFPLDATLGGVSSYLWNTGATGAILPVGASGVFSIEVTDTSGCIGTDTVDITFENLVLNLPTDTSFCQGDSAVLDVGIGANSYSWSNGDTTQMVVVSMGGAVAVTVSNGLCIDSAQTNVAVLALPQPNLGPDTILCNTAVYPLDATTGGVSNYLWNTGATNPILAIVSDGGYSILVTDTVGCIGFDSVDVAFENLVSSLPSDTSFCQGDSILLDAGSGGNSYLWSTGAITQTIIVNTGGIYSVTISSPSCADSASVNVTPLALPQPDIGPDTLLCNVSVFQLDASQPTFVSYLWGGGSAGSTLDVTGSGLYSVTVTDGDGCQGSDSAMITIETLSLVIPADTSFCQGDSVELDAGTSWLNYQWSTGANSQSIFVNAGGMYGVTVSGMICMDSMQVNVTEGSLPGLNLGQDTAICNANSYLLNASVPGAVDYLWNTGDQSPTLQVSSAGLYSVTVSDTSGCQANDQVNISFVEVDVDLPSDTSFCPGNSVLLDAGIAGASYQWSTGASSSSISATTSGTFGVTVSIGSCIDSASVNVLAGVLPGLDLGTDTTLCVGDSLLLDAGPAGLNFTWQDGSNSNTYLVLASGLYAVEVSDSVGCFARDTIEVNYEGATVVSVTGLSALYCESDAAVVLDAQPAGGSWSSGDSIFDPGLVGPGTFTLNYSYTDSGGCADQWSGTTVVDALPTPADAGEDQNLEGSLFANLNANAALTGVGSWTAAGLVFENSMDPNSEVNLPGPGVYSLVWSIANGSCPSSSDTMWIEVDGLFVPNGFSPNGDGTNEFFVIRGIGAYPVRALQVFNRWGNLVFSSDQYNNDWTGGELVDDTYFYILDLGDSDLRSGYVVLKR